MRCSQIFPHLKWIILQESDVKCEVIHVRSQRCEAMMISPGAHNCDVMTARR